VLDDVCALTANAVQRSQCLQRCVVQEVVAHCGWGRVSAPKCIMHARTACGIVTLINCQMIFRCTVRAYLPQLHSILLINSDNGATADRRTATALGQSPWMS
jgi:hypothetical protein